MIDPFLSDTPILRIVIGVILGGVFGSFLTVIISRGPQIWGLVGSDIARPTPFNLAVPRSHCPSCQHTLDIQDLIPIISYAINQGRCRHCGSPIGKQYLVIEVLGVAAGLTSITLFAFPFEAVGAFAFLLFLIALAAIDWRTGYLPDALTFPLIGLGVALSAANIFVPLTTSVIGASLGYGVFAGISWLYKKLRGMDGLGLGDAKLLAGIGAFVGPYALPMVALIATMSALSAVLIQFSMGRSVGANTEIRFGPYLSFAGALTLILLTTTSIGDLFWF